MTIPRQQMTRLHDLTRLRHGDPVEARRYDTVHHRGRIDGLVPHLGILWLRHGPWQERVLLEATAYDPWRPAPATPLPARVR
jgi:hypothetical protein